MSDVPAYDPNQPAIPGLEHLRPDPPEFKVIEVRPHTRKVPINKPPKEETMTTIPTTLADTARARGDDPHTSQVAAATTNVRGSQMKVLKAFQEASIHGRATLDLRPDQVGFIDEELVRWMANDDPLSDSRIRSARKELVRAGLVELARKPDQTPRTRLTRRGREADVYVLTEAGRAFVIPS